MKSYLLFVVLPPLVFLGFTSIIAAVAISAAIDQEWHSLHIQAQNVLSIVEQSASNQYTGALSAVSLLNNVVSSWRTISPQAFAGLGQSLKGKYGLDGCTVGAVVPGQNRSHFEAEMSALYSRPVFIASPANLSQPAPIRPFYIPTTLQSFSNIVVIGMDNNLIPERAELLPRTALAATAQIAKSAIVYNPTYNSISSMVIISAPIYNCPKWETEPESCVAPANVSLRLSSVTGYTGCAANFSLNLPLNTLTPHVDIAICTDNVVMYKTSTKEAVCEGTYSSSFELGGRTFATYTTPRRQDLVQNAGSAVWGLVGLFGFLIFVVPVVMFLFLRDRQRRVITELERERMTEIQMAKLSSEAMKTLLHCTSHDMRAPLQACVNAVGLLKDELKQTTSKLVTNLIEIISGATTFLEALMDNVLDSQKIESNSLELTESPTLISPKIKGLIEMIRTASLAPENVAIESNVDDLPTVMCDFSKVLRMIMNLVSNAAKFTKQGSITVNFKRQTSTEPDTVKVLVEVKDTGCGMTPEQVSKLGTPYVRSSAAKGGGSGLGIFISKSYAGLYGGVFNVESSVGVGTSISFTLTFVRAHSRIVIDAVPDPNLDDASESNSETASEASEDHPVFSPKIERELKVLYCEDHPVTRKVMAMMLEKMNCSVDVAVDGAEASTKILANEYDIVFMDIHMPQKNGDQVVREYREMEAQHRQGRTPIVALTGNVDNEDIEAAKAAGCDHHLSKPCRKESVQQILDAIRRSGLSDLRVFGAAVDRTRNRENSHYSATPLFPIDEEAAASSTAVFAATTTTASRGISRLIGSVGRISDSPRPIAILPATLEDYV